MYIYHFSQWICFFYIYCLLGWIWESTYVSIKDRQWTNRGFMYGPWLPIYGSGAICILFAALPASQNVLLIFLLGAISASILEYVTGTMMEALFKVRYWDYSGEAFNLNGHICLKCSIVWGIFSILLIRVLHKPIEAFVLSIDYQLLTVIIYIITIIITADFALSFKNAFDLRHMLENLTAMNEDIVRMQKRLDVAIAFMTEDKKELTERLDSTKEKLEESITKQHQRVIDLQHEITLRLQASKTSKTESAHMTEKLETWKKELSQISNRFHEYKIKMEFQKKQKNHFRSILSGNPTAVSKKYRKAFEDLKDSLKK